MFDILVLTCVTYKLCCEQLIPIPSAIWNNFPGTLCLGLNNRPIKYDIKFERIHQYGFFKVKNTSILLHKISLIWKQRIYEYVDYETPLRQVWAKISDWCSTIVKEICFHVLSKPRKQEILFYEELVKTTWLNIFPFYTSRNDKNKHNYYNTQRLCQS